MSLILLRVLIGDLRILIYYYNLRKKFRKFFRRKIELDWILCRIYGTNILSQLNKKILHSFFSEIKFLRKKKNSNPYFSTYFPFSHP